MRRQRKDALFTRKFERADDPHHYVHACWLALDIEMDSHGLTPRRHPRRRARDNAIIRHGMHRMHHPMPPRDVEPSTIQNVLARLFAVRDFEEMTVRLGDWYVTHQDGVRERDGDFVDCLYLDIRHGERRLARAGYYEDGTEAVRWCSDGADDAERRMLDDLLERLDGLVLPSCQSD